MVPSLPEQANPSACAMIGEKLPSTNRLVVGLATLHVLFGFDMVDVATYSIHRAKQSFHVS